MKMNGDRQRALQQSWNAHKQAAIQQQEEMQKKVKFAELVLALMEKHEEWNSDLLYAIGEQAQELGLSEDDEFGYFRVKK